MLCPIVAYDSNDEIVATLDYMAARDPETGEVTGLIDFEAHEAAGGKLSAVWKVESAVGSGTWPEWLGSEFHSFRVERAGGRIVALAHKGSGHRRVRADIEAAIAARIAEAKARSAHPVADIRDLVGGPDRPMLLDDSGRTAPRPKLTRPELPIRRVR